MAAEKRKNAEGWELFARCAWGFEDVLAAELKRLGARQVRPLRGGVSFAGTLEDAYRACLWSRVATRVQLVLARVGATTAERLYDAAVAFAWEDHLREGATIAVRAHGTNAALRNTAFTALKVKDAICDRLREVRGARPDVDAARPDFEVDVAVHEQRSTLFLNLSGESLHRRGYRADGVQTEAPLKETLAAGILLMAGWPRLAEEGGALVDPMCGSGTFAIEAALMAARVAPGLLRSRWGFAGWLLHDEARWRLVRAEALAGQEEARGTAIVANDIDGRAIRIARGNARRAGVEDAITWHTGDAAVLGRHLRWLSKRAVPGLVVANPPYGHRLSTPQELPQVYGALAAVVETVPSSWELALITPDAGIDSALGRVPFSSTPCYNGALDAYLRRYDLSDEPQVIAVTSLAGKQHKVRVGDVASEQFAARLRKAAREAARQARRAGADCYRAYDADVPGFGFTLDVYGADGKAQERQEEKLVRLEELPRPRRADPERAACRLADAAAIAAAVFDVDRANVVEVRLTNHSADASAAQRLVTAREGGYAFEVDVAAQRTGLALGQRGVRAQVASMARGKRVACLFASGAAAMVCAAGSDAQGVVVVDASKKHLDEVREQLRANGFGDRRRFAFVCADVRAWASERVGKRERFDLAYCAPPAWLPAKDAGGRDWDAERDLEALLCQAVKLLSPGGSLILLPPTNAEKVEVPGATIEDMADRVGCSCLLLRSS